MNADLKRYYRRIQNYDWTAAAATLSPEGLFHRWRVRAALRAIDRYGAPPFLDLGCGSGLLTRHLPAGTLAVDINPRNLERLRRYAPECTPLLADAEALPLPDSSVRSVVLTEVLEHFPDPAELLTEIRRVLLPGGRLIGTTPADSILWRLRFLSQTCCGKEREPFHREFSAAELRELLSSFFEVREVKRAALGLTWVFAAKKKEVRPPTLYAPRFAGAPRV